MDYTFLSETTLFAGMTAEEIERACRMLHTSTQVYEKGDFIYCMGDRVRSIGLILLGSVFIENDDVWGNHSVLDCLTPGQVFAETYAWIRTEPLMVNVLAAERTEILFLDVEHLIASDGSRYAQQLLQNLLRISMQKNLRLSQRIFHTSSKTIRGRLLSYLSWQAARQGSREFSIPFQRQQLADYLGVDRSAMSHELSKMQKEGLLRVNRSHFQLLAHTSGEGI